MARIEMIGRTFGRLTVLREDGYTRPKKPAYHCQCECGNTTRVDGSFLRSGKTKSCGCIRREMAADSVRAMNTTHGKFGTRIYRIWTGMIQRATNPNSKEFQYYGGRGIGIDASWMRFENFYADMGDPPSDDHSLDRLDNNGNYCVSNCHWATAIEQQNNRRSNVTIEWKGRTQTIAEWARELQINSSTLWRRLANGWSIDEALSTPVMRRRVSND